MHGNTSANVAKFFITVVSILPNVNRYRYKNINRISSIVQHQVRQQLVWVFSWPCQNFALFERIRASIFANMSIVCPNGWKTCWKFTLRMLWLTNFRPIMLLVLLVFLVVSSQCSLFHKIQNRLYLE